ncbi:hypothetical protein ANTPLA_LOCUS9386 [Anthophora plagiata]
MEKEEGKYLFRMNFTGWVDKLLPYVSNFMVENQMDPLTIPDIHRSIWIEGPFLFPPITYNTEMTCTFSSGSLYHLSELERHGTVIVLYGDKTFSVDANIAFDSILLSYDYFLKLLFLRQRGKVLAEATSIWANIGIDFNMITCELTLKRLKLNNIESIRIFPDENNLVEDAIMPLANVLIFLVKTALIKKIEEQAAIFLREYLDRMAKNLCPWNAFNLFNYDVTE